MPLISIAKNSKIECLALIDKLNKFWQQDGNCGKYDPYLQEPGISILLAPRISNPHYNWKGLKLTIVIGDRVLVGYRSIIMGGIKLRKGCIIAASSVATKDTKPFFTRRKSCKPT